LIEYRLTAAGRDGRQQPLFHDDAILPIWQETRGYPRSICLLSLHLCLELLQQGGSLIDEAFVTDFLKRHQSYRRLDDSLGNE
jgi:type II secretory pathway predicted ATPase ExeA